MTTSSTERRGLYGALDRALRILEVAAAAFAACVMVLAMVLTSADALLRYLFNAPITFNTYLTTYYLMAGMLIMPMSWAYRSGGYIRFVFLLTVIPRAAADLMLRAGQLVSAAYFGALTLFSWHRFWDHYTKGDIQMGEIDWPVAWSWICIPVGLGILTLRLLMMTVGPTENLHYGDLLNDEVKDEPI